MPLRNLHEFAEILSGIEIFARSLYYSQLKLDKGAPYDKKRRVLCRDSTSNVTHIKLRDFLELNELG